MPSPPRRATVWQALSGPRTRPGIAGSVTIADRSPALIARLADCDVPVATVESAWLRALLVVAAGLLLLGGCGSDEEAGRTTTAETTTAEARAGGPFGEYEREVTQADLDRTADQRSEGAEVPPVGTYRLTLSEGVLLVVDPDDFSISQELTVTDGTFKIERYIGEGAFCADDSPSSYRWKLDGEKLTLSPQKDGCADRDSILTGSWKTGK